MTPITSLDALRNASPVHADGPVDPKALKAAKDFEAIFLRTLLSSLEKTTSINGGASKPTTGQSTYGSMRFNLFGARFGRKRRPAVRQISVAHFMRDVAPDFFGNFGFCFVFRHGIYGRH